MPDSDKTECNITYHHNFSIHDGKHIYYNTKIPDIIQVSEHQFVEHKVIELWITSMDVCYQLRLAI